MSQVKVNFIYKGTTTVIQCKIDDKISSIIENYGLQAKKDINSLFFLYNGVQLNNKELRYEQIVNSQDKPLNQMNILVYDLSQSMIIESENVTSNNNKIIAVINIKDDDINKDINIISSFEKSGFRYGRDSEFKNEEEIKEKCTIKINNEIIPFSFVYKFHEKGKFIIEYSFNDYMNRTDFMFFLCNSLIDINFSNFKFENVTNMYCMFGGCSSLESINFSNINTQNVTNISYLFSGCTSLTNIDLSSFNTGNVTQMESIFKECTSLKKLDLSKFNTRNVINMYGMFMGCKSLIDINLSSFNTKNVYNMRYMFSQCSSLKYLNLSSFHTESLFNMYGMFYNCSSLTYLDLSNFNTRSVMIMMVVFDYCNSLKLKNVKTYDQRILNLLENKK